MNSHEPEPSKPSVFKFMDRTGKTAFVLSFHYPQAVQLIELETKKDLEISGRISLDQFPKAQELFNEKGPCIWINNIDPF